VSGKSHRTRVCLLALLLSCTFTSWSVASGRVIRKRVTVDAPAMEVWHAWVTNEGATRFFGPAANIELKLGGPYEIYFSSEAPAGQRGSEGCTILSFAPGEMLSFSWNAPPRFGELRTNPANQTRVVLTFKDRGDGKTDVEFVQAGWGDGPQWDELYSYFDRAWDRVLGNLVKHFANPNRAPTPAPEVPYRTIKREFEVNAPRHEAFRALGSAEGLSTWMAPGADVELKVGGAYEVYFNPSAEPGKRGMEDTKVLTFLEDELLSYRGSAPGKYPNVRRNGPWAIYWFEDLLGNRTKVRVTYVGWELRNEEYDGAYEHGQMAADYVMNKLRERFEKGPTTWPASAAPAERKAGAQ
jgi:uncharacterized protein YndB with AHSA1/START domain